ncbi:hypothetical protein SP41_57 [Salmonella phage 41]|nr:hypothetical protein SP41_57 [Salmonella phage 41]
MDWYLRDGVVNSLIVKIVPDAAGLVYHDDKYHDDQVVL